MHNNLAKGVLRYLKYTIDYKLTFCKASNHLKLTAWSDSDFANCQDRKSISGYCFKLAPDSACISWNLSKQSVVADSTCESEYIALNETTKEALSLRQLLQDFDRKPLQTVRIHADNQGAICLTRHPTYHKRTKHFDTKLHLIRDYVQNKFVRVSYVPSAQNTADQFTKPLSRPKLESFSNIRGPK